MICSLCKWSYFSQQDREGRSLCMAWVCSARSEGLAPSDVDHRWRFKPFYRREALICFRQRSAGQQRQSCGRVRDGRPRLGDNYRGLGKCVRRRWAETCLRQTFLMRAAAIEAGDIEQAIRHWNINCTASWLLRRQPVSLQAVP